MDVKAPEATVGGMEVVKMNPGAYDRIKSIIFVEPATYPPTTPYAEN